VEKLPPSTNRQRLIRAFFFVAFGFLLYQMFVLARPFFPGLFGAGLLALAFYPFYNWLKKRIPYPNLPAFLMTVWVVLLAVIPIFFTLLTILEEAGKLVPVLQANIAAMKGGDYHVVSDWIPAAFHPPLHRFMDMLRDRGLDMEPFLINQMKAFGSWILTAGTFTAKKLFLSILNGIILVITLFFAFRDGVKFFEWVLSLIPMEDNHKHYIARRAYETFRAVAVGVGVTALVQGFVAMLGYWMAGVKLPVLFGVLTTAAALMGASILVTVPVALSVWGQSTGWGIFLLVWGLLLVGNLDNVLRPILIGSRARMPFFLILFSIIGGIKAYGLIGIIIGPVLVASLTTFIKIYREEYGQ
jgi:predicted PurR-regulated permease PerM